MPRKRILRTGLTGELERSAFTVDEFCDRNGIGRSSVYKEIESGRLESIRVGTRRLITLEQERAWHLACSKPL